MDPKKKHFFFYMFLFHGFTKTGAARRVDPTRSWSFFELMPCALQGSDSHLIQRDPDPKWSYSPFSSFSPPGAVDDLKWSVALSWMIQSDWLLLSTIWRVLRCRSAMSATCHVNKSCSYTSDCECNCSYQDCKCSSSKCLWRFAYSRILFWWPFLLLWL